MTKLPEIADFLLCKTPDAWLDIAVSKMDLLLIDHANCEKKAALTAIHMLNRYPVYDKLLHKMSRLAREELQHFEKVQRIIKEREVPYVHLSASRYAKGLQIHCRHQDTDGLVDKLIFGAILEARSCERFMALAPLLDDELKAFYLSLRISEAMHFQDYLKLAMLYANKSIDDRVQLFLKAEQSLIQSEDHQFRFHSGVPVLDADPNDNDLD